MDYMYVRLFQNRMAFSVFPKEIKTGVLIKPNEKNCLLFVMLHDDAQISQYEDLFFSLIFQKCNRLTSVIWL